MNFFTHISMGKSIYKHLCKEFPLIENAFIYGNIKPDLEHLSPHLYQTHNYYVMEQIKKLSNFEGTLQEFSTSLGEICHYICDFFCIYHQDESRYHKLHKHFLYEMKTHYTFYLYKWQHRTHKIECDLDDFDRTLALIRIQYLNEDQNANTDLYFAMETAYKLIYEICISNKSRFFLILGIKYDAWSIIKKQVIKQNS